MKKMTFLYHHHSSTDKHTSLVHTLTDMIFFFFTHSHVLQLHGMIFHSGRLRAHTHSYAAAAAPATQMKRKSIFLSRSSLCFVVDSRLFNAFSSSEWLAICSRYIIEIEKGFRQKIVYDVGRMHLSFIGRMRVKRFLSFATFFTNKFELYIFQCLLATTL